MIFNANELISPDAEGACLELITTLKNSENDPTRNPDNRQNVRLNLDSGRGVLTATVSFPIDIRRSAAGKFSTHVIPWLTIPAGTVS